MRRPMRLRRTDAKRSYVFGSSPTAAVTERGDWRRIWYATQSRPWRALALVPGDESIPVLALAKRLMCVGRALGEPVCIADLRGAPHYAGAFLDVVAYHVSCGERILLPTGSIECDLTVPIARGADGAILCATLGATSLKALEETAFLVGKERFIGSVLVGAAPDDDPVELPFTPWTRLLSASS